jgi:alanine racemase
VAQTDYAFIVKAPGYGLQTHQAVLESPELKTRVVGVASASEALQAADALLKAGVDIVELSGGFSAKEARRIRARFGPSVCVGVVTYEDE